MIEVFFLVVLGILWLTFASVSDLKFKEVPNWLCFSLIVFGLGVRFFYSLFSNDFNFLYQGIFGLGIFFLIGNMLYYARFFAGGDAKLLIALGVILPFGNSFFENLNIFLWWFILFFISGAVYGLGATIFFTVRDFKKIKKEFVHVFKKNKSYFWCFLILFGIFLGISFIEKLFLVLGIFSLLGFLFYVYGKAIEESSMVRDVRVKDLREGDWLYTDLRLGGKILASNWEGLSNKEIALIKKHKKFVKIRQGIAFVPVFWISFFGFIVLYFLGYFFKLF